MKTTITELLGIEYPIIQGGMAWVAEHHLAAAVSNAGGLGIIGAASAPPEIVREEIRKQDNTVPCIVNSVNEDSTVDLCILPDLNTVIKQIPNPNRIDCREGDTVLLYKVRNQINNSFIIVNYNRRI